jgi:hypothetical protein
VVDPNVELRGLDLGGAGATDKSPGQRGEPHLAGWIQKAPHPESDGDLGQRQGVILREKDRRAGVELDSSPFD